MRKPKKALTKEEILRLASLSKLDLNDSEVRDLESKLSKTISFIENLQEIDTSKIVVDADTRKNVFRNDEVDSKRQFSQEEALANAAKTRDGFFVVDRIL